MQVAHLEELRRPKQQDWHPLQQAQILEDQYVSQQPFAG